MGDLPISLVVFISLVILGVLFSMTAILVALILAS